MTAQRLAPPVTDLDHVQGDGSALVTLIEYGDFECPSCGKAYPVLKRVKQRLGDRLRFVFRNFPIAQNHPHAEHAAEAAESVATLGGNQAFWTMHDLLFENQKALDDDSLAGYAEEAGVDGRAVLLDLADARYQRYVRDSFMNGVRSGVNGTPTFYINGVRHDDSYEAAVLIEALERAATTL